MKYKIECGIFFEDEATASELYDLILQFLFKAVNINIGKPNEERSKISLHKCYHDEETPRPCEYYRESEVRQHA